MNAMILAAGRGERMRPLTDDCPKPLLRAGGRALIDYHLDALATAGYHRVVINTAWQGQRLREHIGAGRDRGLDLRFSDEGEHALETAGGIAQALPLLGSAPFVVINGDIHTDYPLAQLGLRPGDHAHLVLVDNPAQHARGDFGLTDGRVVDAGAPALTFSGIGVYRPELFAGLPAGPARLAPLLADAIAQDRIGGEHYRGEWHDVGTPERLQELDTRLRQRSA